MIYLTLIFIQILFGLNFVTSKYVLAHVDAWNFVLVRFLISGVTFFALLYLFPRLRGFASLKLEKKYLFWAIGLSILGFSLSQTLFLQGLKMTTATNTSILSTTIPLFTYVVAIARRKRQFDFVSLGGFILASIAILILKEVDQVSLGEGDLIGDTVVLLACLSIASFISYSRDFFMKVPSSVGTAYLFLFGAIFLLPFSIDSQSWEWLSELSSPLFLSCLLFTIFGATLLTYFLSHWVIKKVSSEYLSLYIFLQPIVASLVGWAFLGETINWRLPMVIVLMFSGVLMVTLKEVHERDSN